MSLGCRPTTVCQSESSQATRTDMTTMSYVSRDIVCDVDVRYRTLHGFYEVVAPVHRMSGEESNGISSCHSPSERDFQRTVGSMRIRRCVRGDVVSDRLPFVVSAYVPTARHSLLVVYTARDPEMSTQVGPNRQNLMERKCCTSTQRPLANQWTKTFRASHEGIDTGPTSTSWSVVRELLCEMHTPRPSRWVCEVSFHSIPAEQDFLAIGL